MKVPDVERCCFCFPLRGGIVVFGVINTLVSLLAVARLAMATERHSSTSTTDHYYLDMVTTMVLLSIFGMSVILNILLFVGGCQKDPSLLRLYNYYAFATIVAALIPTTVQVWRLQYREVGAIFIAIAMQVYVILLVRSEVIKIEEKQNKSEGRSTDITVEVSDRETLI